MPKPPNATLDFDAVWSALKTAVRDLAELTVRKYAADAIKDADKFLKTAKADVERWTLLLAAGDLTTEDFEWLIESKKDVAALTLLHQSGLALIRVDQFKASLFNLIIDTVFGIVFKK